MLIVQEAGQDVDFYHLLHCFHPWLIPHHLPEFSLGERGKKHSSGLVGVEVGRGRRNFSVGWKGYKNRGRT